MQISKISISHLRAVKDLSVDIGSVTALLGGNNVGKSTVLKALELFFEASPTVTDDDFYKREDHQIEITITFHNLVQDELDSFGSAVVDDCLTLKRSIEKGGEKQPNYAALAYSYGPFSKIRALSGKKERSIAFNQLTEDIEDLAKVNSAEAADLAMNDWEAANPEKLELAFRRGFFGATNVANGMLKKKTSLHLVPAVADAEQEAGGAKGSPIISLLSEVAKQIYENRKEVADFVSQANETFAGLVDPKKVPELHGLSDLLTASVQRYYQDSSLLADWQTGDGLSVAFPKPRIRVEDHGFETSLANVGHGLQRASLFAIIQFLGERQHLSDGDEEFSEPASDIILLVEEPEIYQHPNKQLVISEAFHSICKGFSKSTGIRFQIVFTTHSEKFVGLQKFQSARVLRRVDGFATPSHTARGISISECCSFFAKVLGREPLSDEAFEAKMHIFSREVCEGFFADKVVLVEGVTDKALLEGFFKSRGLDTAAEGIAVISVEGKGKLDKPLHIFSTLGIPTYPVFDSDFLKAVNKQKPAINQLIQRIVGHENPEDFPNGCFPNFMAFHSNLEKYLKNEIGTDKYTAIFDRISEELGLPQSDLCKTPLAITKIVEIAEKELGTKFSKFEELMTALENL